ncbi:MAG: hypothetical protein E6K68_00070 [Nitrospirae bacterium]|nr:MAG: hypothetical protein E6K68_00070 [Nitrospirota bacterium]
MSEDLVEAKPVHPDWEAVRARLRRNHPTFFELEAGGALLMDLGSDGWLLELTPDGRLLCQMGVDIEDVMSLMSEGTPEDLGTDEVAKQAKYYLQPAVAKFRPALRGAGFEETNEMTEDYVAATFHKAVDYHKPDEVEQMVRWCRQQFGI